MAGCMKLLPPLLCMLAWVGSVDFAFAQKPTSSSHGMADPTRPPAELTTPFDSAAVGDGKSVAASGGLQTVILRKGVKPMAVINGETVWLGGKLGDARLVRLSETEAELDGPNGKEIMRITPSVEKKIIQKQKVIPNQSRGRAKHVSKKTNQN